MLAASPRPTTRRFTLLLFVGFFAALPTACGGAGAGATPAKPALPLLRAPVAPADPAPRHDAAPVLIRGATVWTAAGAIHSPGFVFLRGGQIEAVGAGDGPPVGTQVTVVDATGKFVTPGIIDTHSHMGVYPLPYVTAHDDGNEASSPATPEVWAEHGFWPQDPSLERAVSSGVTSAQILPGSANLIGGRSLTIKLLPERSARAMRFPGAPQGLKMACGENPKRVHGERGGPKTRMGNVAGFREKFQRAVEYRRGMQRYERDLAAWKKKATEAGAEGATGDEVDPPDPPARDFGLETLAAVLDGKILVHNHCYRADEMHLMLDLADEFGFSIRSFHHALEAYKLRDRLAQQNVATSTWADWWGFKMEAYDGIPHNAALLADAGARVVIHSDSEVEIRHLNQEAQKARVAGAQLGIELDDDTVLRWITLNPAWALGIDGRTGSLEAGKMADLVVWDQYPFSTYARAEKVFIDGELAFDRRAPSSRRRSDFEIGRSDQGVAP